ncbi:hypothetical protein VNO77_40018 [Canavalia gladiata]|uniref:C2H2-type domain-containing protein n=1 Tax=Canavalia gladiata TaxID=3824 RepID=A0AAN9PRQ4_CANGL
MTSSSEKASSSALKLFGFPLTSMCNEEIPCEMKKIECPFCDRKFQNLQALGGHQNAHRRERQIARLAQFQYMHSQMFQACKPLAVAKRPEPSNLPRVLSPPPVFAGATWFWRSHPPSVLTASPKLPVAEPPGTRHRIVPPIVQVPVVGVGDNIDLELRLATTYSKESGR